MHDPNFIVLWEPGPMVKTEYRLYHDDSGRILFYTCEKPEGKYLVIDAVTYASCSPDLRVVDGRISTVQRGQVISRLVPGVIGTLCAKEDISIMVETDGINWELKVYEL